MPRADPPIQPSGAPGDAEQERQRLLCDRLGVRTPGDNHGYPAHFGRSNVYAVHADAMFCNDLQRRDRVHHVRAHAAHSHDDTRSTYGVGRGDQFVGRGIGF
jgi:hypothetical protein